VASGLETPAPNRLTDCLKSLRARSRQEGCSVESGPPLRFARSKLIPQKVEADHRMFPFAIGVLTVDDLGLIRVKHQPTFGEPPVQGLAQRQSLRLAAAMTDGVIGVSFKRHTGKRFLHPQIEGV